MKLLPIFSLIGLCACVMPTEFTTADMMKVHQGMSANEIRTMFGEPRNISVDVCGRPPREWTCTTWEYGDYTYDTATFTFNGEHNSLKLNNFKVNREQL